MEIQTELNQKNAKFNTAQAKEMWNYINGENQTNRSTKNRTRHNKRKRQRYIRSKYKQGLHRNGFSNEYANRKRHKNRCNGRK